MDGNQMKICAQVKIAAKHDQETRNPHNQKELKRRRHLIPFDCVITVCRFFGRKHLKKFGPESKELDHACRLSPVFCGRRIVPDLFIKYKQHPCACEDKWLSNDSFPLPIVDPPRAIIGFNRIEICVDVGGNIEDNLDLEVPKMFLEKTAHLLNKHKLEIDINARPWETEYWWLRIPALSEKALSLLNAFPLTMKPFPFVSLKSDLRFDVGMAMLETFILRNANVLCVDYIFSIEAFKKWLYYLPLAAKTGAKQCGALRILHIRYVPCSDFWKLVDSICEDFKSGFDGSQHEFALVFEDMRGSEISNERRCERAPGKPADPFCLVNEQTGKTLTFERIKLEQFAERELFVLRHRPAAGPLLSIVEQLESNENLLTLKIYNEKLPPRRVNYASSSLTSSIYGDEDDYDDFSYQWHSDDYGIDDYDEI